MFTQRLTRLFWLAEAVVLAAVVVAAVRMSTVEEWRPVALVLLLLGLVLAGDRLIASVGSNTVTTAHIAMVLAICLLGPAPAVAFGLSAAILSSGVRRVPRAQWLNNLVSLSLYAFVGAMLVNVLVGDVHDPSNLAVIQSVTFGLVVVAVSLLTITINFAVVAVDVRLEDGRPLIRQAREAFIPLLPRHLTAGLIAALLAVAYTNLGLSVLFASILVLGAFHYLTAALLRSEERADQLEARSIHLANMQLGVLGMLMDALALRDPARSRHATAVARYAKALAIEIGCDEAEQEVIHTAGLLHDIGKFTWSDRVLHPQQLTDEDWAVIRRHPQDGAALVGKLDGYGPVADAILYHHERIDGGGYPAGLIGNEIPLASRVVAVCSTFDTMIATTTYGPLMAFEDAIAELRNIAGRQLDAELVERFVAILQNSSELLAGDGAGYEAELAFEQRVKKMAQPSPGETTRN
jgi:putative nucleotidyltransferase with HDIG domain